MCLTVIAGLLGKGAGGGGGLPTIGGVYGWFETDVGVTLADTDKVVSVSDQSGSGNHISKPSDLLRPTLIAGVPGTAGGHPIIRHSNGPYRRLTKLSVANAPTDQLSLAMVYRPQIALSQYGFLSNNGPAAIFGIGSGNGANGVIGGFHAGVAWVVGDRSYDTAADGDFVIVLATRAVGGPLKMWVNGTEMVLSDTTSVNQPGGVTNICIGDFSDGSRPGPGDWVAAMFSGAVLTGTERNDLFAYYAAKYEIALD
jgi:hypothetical protein